MTAFESLSDHEAAAAVPLDVEDLVCVSRPYFALEDLRRIGPGRVVATVPIESDPGRQAAVIGVGEVGRHLAILGLCAASTVNRRPGRFAYLARGARVEWLADPTLAPQESPLIGHAKAAFTTSRKATADARLTDAFSGEILARMSVSYDVLPHRLLTRLLEAPVPGETSTLPAAAPSRGAVPPARPYGEPVPLEKFRLEPATGILSAELPVTAALCPGHFDGHPVLPVAIAATAMTTLVDRGVAELYPHARWLAGPLTLTADAFARAGETVTFTATPTQAMTYQCVARTESRTVASVNIQLVLVDPRTLTQSVPPVAAATR
ncbi:hypothetical protein [Streptomyces candidus]|uniref:3-hydroxymyristoyl/3-hydroxydecanoyl-(Acyl carrier protein) dehydratase n=1 Tax=Streptomyces candidus TaxID=67283 RepID=A0A7X0LSV7_9ACTN|nr:hypothetical protein [Streptomyces candidus]MBB6439650.1 3-hydroxymyristoyl/3-hydroxydecanoyl-(acyl carrier protein) dehydratase [Streptomyces candidus]GHH56248.1 hypothetical protein GCM10018773_61960 [Streptomyces candidus]